MLEGINSLNRSLNIMAGEDTLEILKDEEPSSGLSFEELYNRFATDVLRVAYA